jgi:tripartite-type tricarboxylate transporter receptor subunit TctC
MKKNAAYALLRPLICIVAIACASTPAIAQKYPTKPIRLVVPYVPGGATDILARELAQKVRESLGQAMVIDNRPGGSAIIGTELVAKAVPDGYTLVLSTQASHAINVSLFNKLPYDPVKDFSHLSLLASIASVLVVNPAVPAKSVSELINLARSQPGKLNFGSTGNGLLPHLSGELFKTMAKIDVVHVPYNGSGPALTSLIAGDAAYLFNLIPPTLPFIKAGRLRGLAVTSAKRSTVYPELPTVAEAALPGFQLVAWFGISAPAGTPAPIVQTLNEAIVKAMNSPDVKARLFDQGIEVATNTPQQFTDYVKSEIGRWGNVVKVSGAKSNF